MTGYVNKQFQGSDNSAKAPKHNITKEPRDTGKRGVQIQPGVNKGAKKEKKCKQAIINGVHTFLLNRSLELGRQEARF